MNGCAAYMKSLETALFRVSWDASLASSEILDRSLGIYCPPSKSSGIFHIAHCCGSDYIAVIAING